MKKVHVFNAGPCLLPQVAIDAAVEALKDFKGTGVSLISISHRTKEWESVMDEVALRYRDTQVRFVPIPADTLIRPLK